MKNSITFLLAVLFTAIIWAQIPQKMSYQAVVRDASNACVANQAISMKISILLGSANSNAVYVETHTPTTNPNGLVSLEIGSGTIESGTFAGINWANGTCFIKTETDLAGGTNYTITGTSQLLSVPYALHAKTAENGPTMPFLSMAERDALTPAQGAIIYNTNTKKPNIYDGTQWMNYDGTAAIIQTPIITWENPTFIGVGTPLSATQLNASANIPGTYIYNPAIGTVLGVGNDQNLKVYFIPNDNANYNSTSKTVTINVVNLTIGLNYQGGIIAYILQSGDPGYDANVTHGLIAAPSDQSAQARWGCYGTTLIGADGTAIGTGSQNTIDIVTLCLDQGTAAQICSDLVLGGYSDWYLPSKDELNKLYLSKTAIGGFANADYRSSSEVNNLYAWTQSFYTGDQNNSNFKDYQYRVRAIRSF